MPVQIALGKEIHTQASTTEHSDHETFIGFSQPPWETSGMIINGHLHLFSEQIFIEHLLCVRHNQRFTGEKNQQGSNIILCRKVNKKQKYSKQIFE